MSHNTTVLVVGATRGLGAELTKQYAARPGHAVYGTSRKGAPDDRLHDSIEWITGIDVASESVGQDLLRASLPELDVVIISAGYFGFESFDEPSHSAQVTMYKTSAIGPVFIVHALYRAGLLRQGSKVVLVSSEAGSLALRHRSEGGGNYGHHASKAALNMVGRLLSFDVRERGVAVGMIHPGFMRTEMTRSVGFDKFWDDGGAVTPAEAAESVMHFIEQFNMEQTGQFFAPRGPADIGTWEDTIGPKKDVEGQIPLPLPW